MVEGLVCGLNHNYVHIQEKLSNMSQLTFEKAVEMAVTMTMVKESARQFRHPGGAASNTTANANQGFASVNRLKYASKPEGGRFLPRDGSTGGCIQQHQKAPRQQCWRCGGKHAPQSCKFKAERCFSCGKIGHIAKLKACKGKPRVHVITEATSEDVYNVYTASTVSKGGGTKIPVCVEDTQFSMQLDTVADVSLVPESFMRSTSNICHCRLLALF